MLNVHELERRWLRYRIKRVLPIALTLLTGLILGVAALIYWPLSQQQATSPVATASTDLIQYAAAPQLQHAVTSEPTKSSEAPAQNQPADAEVSTTPPVVAVQEPATTAPSNVLRPSMDFMQSIKRSAEEEQGRPRASVPAAPEKPRPTPQKTQVKVAAPQDSPAEPATTLSITQEDANDLKDVVKRFETNKNPALSLFLARRYYDLQEYAHSYEYALKTNEIDSTIEESWLIFAKSLVKLGRNEEAVKTLSSYIQHSNSGRAKSLLDEINKGTFQ